MASVASDPIPLPLALRVARVVAALAAGAVLALVAAFWAWRWLGPAPAIAPVAREPASWAPAILATPMFGQPAAPVAAASSAAPVASLGDTRLLGVLAERDGGGYALFSVAGKGPLLVRAGSALADGVTLVAVRPDSVRLSDHGETRDIALRANDAPATRAAATPGVAARSACIVPAGYRGAVYRLSAELLSGIAAQPGSWQSLVEPRDGALVVRQSSALATALGLSAGDRIAQANGIALAGIDDVVTAIVRPLLASQPVKVSGTHDGRPAEWMLVNAGTC